MRLIRRTKQAIAERQCWREDCDRPGMVKVTCRGRDRVYCREHFHSIAQVPAGSSITWA